MAGPKTAANTQALLASALATRAGAGFAAVPAGSGVEPLADLQGVQWMRLANALPPGFTSRWQAPMLAANFGEVLRATPARLEQASGYVSGALGPAALTWVQFYDAVIPGAPPVMEIPIVGAGTWAWSPGLGWDFAAAIFCGFSLVTQVYVPVVGGGAVNASGFAP